MKPLERRVLDALPATVFAVDLDGRITLLNRSPSRFGQQDGAPPLPGARAAIGASIWETIGDPGVKDQVRQALATLSEGRASTASWELDVGSAGAERTLLVQASALEDSRALVGYVFVVSDTTTRHKESDMPARHGHKRRSEAIADVSAGVAQELRNPLFGISSAAQLLRFRVKDDPVVEKNVGRILREVERLNSVVAALLEYGRPTPLPLHARDPDLVWDGLLEKQRGSMESRVLHLDRARAEPPVSCSIDAQQLAEVFLNVLGNAVDAAPEGGKLSLKSSLAPDGTWHCRLHNDGPAIPTDVLPRVFELFFSTKGATGIGLSLSRRIVEGHGGTLSLESTPAQGTAATIVLPPA